MRTTTAWPITGRGAGGLNPDEDIDGDSVSNLDEFHAGTDPRINLDTDGDGLPDDWEIFYLGDLSQDGETDSDGDGLSNLSEYFRKWSPSEYYNDGTPVITILEGDNQTGPAGYYLPVPLTVRVTTSYGKTLINAPITFKVNDPDEEISLTGEEESGVTELTLHTDSHGLAWVYWKPGLSLNATISATGGRSSIQASFNIGEMSSTSRLPPMVDRNSDTDGFTDYEETLHGTSPTDPDTDHDGVNDDLDGWPLDKCLAPARQLDTQYAVIPVTQLGWPKDNFKSELIYTELFADTLDDDLNIYVTDDWLPALAQSVFASSSASIIFNYDIYSSDGVGLDYSSPYVLSDDEVREGRLYYSELGKQYKIIYPYTFFNYIEEEPFHLRYRHNDIGDIFYYRWLNDHIGACVRHADGSIVDISFASDLKPLGSSLWYQKAEAVAGDNKGNVITLEVGEWPEFETVIEGGNTRIYAKNVHMYNACYIHGLDGSVKRVGGVSRCSVYNIDLPYPAQYVETSGELFYPIDVGEDGIIAGYLIKQNPEANGYPLYPLASGDFFPAIWDGSNVVQIDTGATSFSIINDKLMKYIPSLGNAPPVVLYTDKNNIEHFVKQNADKTWEGCEVRDYWDVEKNADPQYSNFVVAANDRGEMVLEGPSWFLIRNNEPLSLDDRVPEDWEPWWVGDINNNGALLANMKNPKAQLEECVLIPASLRVDANRDGEINDRDLSATSYAQPFRFWINDDIDRKHTFKDSEADTMDDIDETEEDDIGPEEAEDKLWNSDCWTDNKADSKRDLEDFARLQFDTAGLNDSFKNGQLFLGLKWSNATGDPAIRVYQHLDPAGGLGYLTDDTMATAQRDEYAIRDVRYQNEAASSSTHTIVRGSEVFILPPSLFVNLSESNPQSHFLFEGVQAGKGQLTLAILKQENGTYTEIGDGPGVWMDLKEIGDMYEHWSVGNASGGPPDSIAARIPSLTGSGTAFRYDNPDPSPEEKKYILYVHGWNMEQWEKERFAETAYKRLWWQGYKGRFGLFSWPCTNRFDEVTTLGKVIEGITDGTNYDRGEWSAWRSGSSLRQLLQVLNGGYGGQLYVLSHSMGGIAMSEALRLQSDAAGGQIVKVYVASQAALSAHQYDGTLSTATGSASAVQWTYLHPSFAKITDKPWNYGPDTTNIYKNWSAYLLNGSAVSSKAVGTLVNFYNENDYALSAPVWQFNQLTKPDCPDPTSGQPWTYKYLGDPAYFEDAFVRGSTDGSGNYPLHLGSRANPEDRYEIMAFAAESYVKAFGATPNLSQGITRPIDLRTIWPEDGGDHKAHRWHSGQFRSTIQKQKDYWKTLLGRQAFDITTGVLP